MQKQIPTLSKAEVMTKTTQDLILDWLEKIDGKVDNIQERVIRLETKSEQPRTTITPSVPIRKFDGKIRIDIVQLAKLLAWIATIVGAAFGVDFVIH